jgi:hypothetical protein
MTRLHTQAGQIQKVLAVWVRNHHEPTLQEKPMHRTGCIGYIGCVGGKLNGSEKAMG